MDYEENDSRYLEVIKIAKKLLSFVVEQKTNVSRCISKRIKEKKDKEESEKIIADFMNKADSQKIFSEKLNKNEIEVVKSDFNQFTRVINISNATKKVFISHRGGA